MKYPDAVKFNQLTFDEVIEKNLSVMDMSAFTMCKENKMPIRVFSLDHLERIFSNTSIGTLIF